MEMNLVDYGIQNEESDIRIHVCYRIKRIYVFRTADGQAVIKTGRYKNLPAYQWIDGVRKHTADGYVVPPSDIANCREIELPHDIWQMFPMAKTDSTSRRGKQAVCIVRAALLRGHIALPLITAEITNADLQIRGEDIIVKQGPRIQVKCDFDGGNKALKGTGNLYLQVAEINPLKAR